MSEFSQISLKPLSGILDTRSEPADIPIGAFRYKLNFRVNDTNHLERRDGHERLFASRTITQELGVDLNNPDGHSIQVYPNYDHHRQGAARELITFGFESTRSSGARTLFDGTQSRISKLVEATGLWTDIVTGKGEAGARWKAAELQDYVLFTNNVDNILAHELGTDTVAEITELRDNRKVTASKVIIQWKGVIFLMNIVQDATGNSAGDVPDPLTTSGRKPTRIVWGDLNKPLSFKLDTVDTIAGFQDLTYGDDILNAGILGGTLYIFTRRSIWKCVVQNSEDAPFGFFEVYSEPKNQKACLAYPNTLVSDGEFFWYLSRDGWYCWNGFLSAPERPEWLHRATGVVFKTPSTKIDETQCDSPVCEFVPLAKELWLSWPSLSAGGINNQTLVVNTSEQSQTGDIVDTGYTMLVNFRSSPTGDASCNEVQTFIGASNIDWALKAIGQSVFSREFLDLDYEDEDLNLETDITLYGAEYIATGYKSILRGAMPLGFPDREKLVRMITADAEATEQAEPCIIRARVGNSYKVSDPNDNDGTCNVIWRTLDDVVLTCPNKETRAQMVKDNLKPDSDFMWPCYEQNRYLYFEFTVLNKNGSAAIGGRHAFTKIDFDAVALPK